MGEVIENKVVQMAFDNTKFEKGVQTTLNILGRLTNTLNGLNSIKYNLLGVADQVKAVTFDPINAQLQIGVGKAMALTAALTGVYNITDQIYGTMTGLIRSMTFDQITNGFSRYEQVVNSTQTILAASRKEGESMEQAMERVEAVQERLLWFADETSYDAQGMLSVISQFTSHGIELDDAATAMEGIANWAATAGVNATNATYAMEQLAQTLGKGYVQRQDWVSIQSRNMDTTKFKELVVQAAVAKGELKKVGDEVRTLDGTLTVTTSNMEQSLSKNWFTKEVLMDVLTRYGEANAIIKKVQDENPGMLASEAVQKVKEDAQYAEYMLAIEAFEMAQVARTWTDAYESVMTATATKLSTIFKTIFGDYLEAKELWTQVSEKLYDIFVTPLDTVMQAFQKWSDPNGFNGSKRFWDSMWKIFTAIEDTVSVIWECISKIFGGIEASDPEIEDYVERTEGWVDVIANLLIKASKKFDQFAQNVSMFFTRLRINQKVYDGFLAFLRGLSTAFDLLRQMVHTFIERAFNPLLNKAEDGLDEVAGLGFSFESLMDDIAALIEKTDFFNKVFDTTASIAGKLLEAVTMIFGKIEEVLDKVSKKNSAATGKGGFFTSLLDDVNKAEGPLNKIVEIFNWLIGSIGYGISNLLPLTENALNIVKNIFGGLGSVFEGLLPVFQQIGGVFKYIFDTVVDAIKTSGGDIGGLFNSIAGGIGVLVYNIGSGNLNTLERFFAMIRGEVKFYKELLFGGMTVPEFINECSVALFLLIVGVSSMAASLESMIVKIAAISKVIEAIQELQWDGLLGQLLWGDSLTNITDQLYYKALAQTFAAVADGILMIAAALFIISLVKEDRLRASMEALHEISSIMFQMIILVEVVSTIFSKLEQFGKGDTYGEGILGKIGAVLGFSPDSLMVTAKYAGMAAMIAAVSSSFLKVALAMLLIATIADDEAKLKRVKGTVIMIAGCVTAMMLAMGAILMLTKSSGGIKFKGAAATDFLVMAAAVILICGGISKIAKALYTLSGIESDKLTIAATALGGIMIVMTVFMAFTAYLGKSEANFLAVGRMVSLVGLSLLIIAGAFTLMDKIKDPDSMAEKAKWLGIAFGALMGSVIALMLLSKVMKADDIAAIGTVAGLVVTLSVAMIAIAGALTLLSGVQDPKKLTTAAETLGGVFVAFFLLIAASAFIKPQQVLSVAGSLAIICISMLALIPLMKACMEIDDTGMENLKKIAIGLGAFLGLVVTASVIIASNPQLSAAIGYMYAISGVLVVLSATGLIASVGILALAAAFTIFVDTLEKLQGLNGEKIKENMLNVASFFPEFMVILWQGLADSLNVIMLQPLDFIREIITKIFLAIINAAAAALPDLIKFIKEATVNVIDMARTVLPLIFDFLNEFGALLTEKVTAGTIMILFAVFEGLVEGFEKIAPRIPEIINRFADTLIANGKDIIEAFGRLAEPLGQMVSGLLEHLITVIDTSSDQIRSLVRSLLTLIFDIVNDFGVMLTDKVTAGTIRITMAIFGGLIEGFLTGIPEFIDQTAELIIEFINAMADVLDEHGDDFLDAIDRLLKSIVDFVYKAVVHWADDGGIFFEGGVQIVSGITRGITSRLQAVKKAAFTLGDWVRNGFCEILGIKSPSKVFETFGNFIIQGLLKGIDAHKDTVLNSLGSFGQKLKDTFGDKISNFGGLEDVLGGMLNSIDVDIIPNLDLTNLKGSLHEITDLFGEQQLEGMVGVNGFNIDDISNGMDSVSLTNGLDSLNGKMDQLIKVQEFNLEKPQDVNVVLEGDTSKFFKAIRKENTKRTRATGYNALMGAQA